MPEPFVSAYLLLFAAALGVSWLLTPLARRLALAIGLVDQPGERKIHREATPYGGGLAMFASFALLVGGVAAWLLLREPVLDVFSTVVEQETEDGTLLRLLAIFTGATAMFLLGVIDDRFHLRPWTKLLVQILAAAALLAADVRITFFVENDIVTAAGTVLWIVAVTNAFNLLDNMDGLSAGVAAVAAALFFVVALQGDQILVGATLAVLAGVLLGFLRYNFPPARLFMGDAGSLFIGFLLASLTVTGTFYAGRGSLYAVFMPVLILGVPLFDTISVMFIRWRTGKPFFVGDTNHLSHRLVRLGMTRREAVLTIYLLGLILGGAATLLRQLDETGAIIVLLIGIGVIALIVLLENAARRRNSSELP